MKTHRNLQNQVRLKLILFIRYQNYLFSIFFNKVSNEQQYEQLFTVLSFLYIPPFEIQLKADALCCESVKHFIKLGIGSGSRNLQNISRK